jgi:hypothetical protein
MGPLRPFDLVAGAGGVVLLVSLFLRWYGVEHPPVPEGNLAAPALTTFGPLDATGWESFTVLDVVLAAVALVAIAVPIVTATATGPAKPVAIDVIVTVLTPLAVLLIAYRMLNEPGPNEAIGLRFGAWVGLAGALIAFAGSFGALKDESTPGAVPPDVPRRPAPPATAA